ncbi:hypothetical protein AIGOOFII_1680 [Methylobacterium marchantiae]|nr:hypothetical protein AIGOOFII_1680 [Methylobacterium marchantiae]
MTIFGVALLALCTLIGVFLGVKANVGGVGLAMIRPSRPCPSPPASPRR